MRRSRLVFALTIWLFLASPAVGADPPLATASGTVKKATANTLLISPRGPDGRFQETLVLILSGTTKVFTLTTPKRGGQPVAVQQETDPRNLQPNQTIAVIYAHMKNDLVLLTAVVHPVPAR